MREYCFKCKKVTDWHYKKALVNPLTSSPDFIGDKPDEFKRGQTVNPNQKVARLTQVKACKSCGRSISANQQKEKK